MQASSWWWLECWVRGRSNIFRPTWWFICDLLLGYGIKNQLQTNPTPGSWSIGPPNVVPKLFSSPFAQNNSISQPTFAHPLFFQTTNITLGPFFSYSVWWAISFFCSISPCLVDTVAVGKIIENVENLFDDSDDLHEAAWVDGLTPFWGNDTVDGRNPPPPGMYKSL